MSDATPEAKLWVSRVCARYPVESAAYTKDQLLASMKGWLGLVEAIGIEEPGDKIRLLGLSVLLTPAQRQSRLANGVLKRILHIDAWEPKQRIDFIYRHLVGRAVSTPEEDFGARFVPF